MALWSACWSAWSSVSESVYWLRSVRWSAYWSAAEFGLVYWSVCLSAGSSVSASVYWSRSVRMVGVLDGRGVWVGVYCRPVGCRCTGRWYGGRRIRRHAVWLVYWSAGRSVGRRVGRGLVGVCVGVLVCGRCCRSAYLSVSGSVYWSRLAQRLGCWTAAEFGLVYWSACLSAWSSVSASVYWSRLVRWSAY